MVDFSVLRDIDWTMPDLRIWLHSLLQPASAVEHEADALPAVRLHRAEGQGRSAAVGEMRDWAFIGDDAAAGFSRGASLIIPDELCFRRRSQLPRSSAAYLPEIMDVEFAGITSIDRSEFFGGSYAHSVAAEQDFVIGEQILVTRSLVSALLDRLAAKGVTVSALAFAGPAAALHPVVLQINGEAYGSARLRRWWGFTLGSAILAMVLFGVFLMTVSQQEDALTQRLLRDRQMLEAQAQSIRKKLAEQKSVSEGLGAILKAERGNARTLIALEETTRLLPDDAFLQVLVLDGKELTLDGLAAEPETLISAFEKSPLFAATSFLAPAYRDPASGRSHFTLKAAIEAEAAQP
ncbi:PilN domain-containing protein [Aestuariivirga sp.]|uniref:PilN domain-containing protein n=1 Tax=Aestuariivirga sp. TaxID=2650926 RepID=UPI003BAD3B98